MTEHRAGSQPRSRWFSFPSRPARRFPSASDIIVCWQHDWVDCPVQLIALSQVIKRRRGRKGDT